jgi:hypothetical protein
MSISTIDSDDIDSSGGIVLDVRCLEPSRF